MAAHSGRGLVLSLVTLLAAGVITSGRLPMQAANATPGTPQASSVASPVATPSASPVASPTGTGPMAWVELGPDGTAFRSRVPSPPAVRPARPSRLTARRSR